jgi:GntR family transcriptional repressor for pyruvate dehydrogenase complex
MLSARGLVEVAKGRGVFVKNVTAQSVTDPMHLYLQMQFDEEHALYLVHARQVIEPPIAASAARHHTSEDAEKLLGNLEELKRSEDDFALLARLDMEFHLNVAKASENPIIPLILEPIHMLMPKIKSSIYAAVDDAKQSAIIWHEKILNAILARDAEGASKAMTDHLGIAEEHIRRVMQLEAEKKKVNG